MKQGADKRGRPFRQNAEKTHRTRCPGVGFRHQGNRVYAHTGSTEIGRNEEMDTRRIWFQPYSLRSLKIYNSRFSINQTV
jgi:hypothetical protein